MTEAKQLKMKQIKVNTLRQNCFASECREASVSTVSHDYKIKKYQSLEKHILPNGMTFDLEEVDYPITPESVTSYVDSADYRRDPLGAIASAPKRVNLGDISQVQDFIKENPQEAIRLYRSVGEQLAKYYEDKDKQTPSAVPAPEN